MTLSELLYVIFVLTISLCFLIERLIPHHKPQLDKMWVNYVMIFISSTVVYILIPLKIADFSHPKYDLINLGFYLREMPLIITLVFFDFCIYWQHRLFHQFNFLWKFHAVHHSDQSLDQSSGVRFHPGEIFISALYKLVLVLIFRPQFEAFILYEGILFTMSVFNHSNINLPTKANEYLKYLIVTPQMHYSHHDKESLHLNRNYGNFLSIWDRIFKSYESYETSNFGLNDYSEEDSKSLKQLLIRPFKK
jgi:sterol desaturase/sphingolipid hydroxylase (fatty acid hydroxylase superfamily)